MPEIIDKNLAKLNKLFAFLDEDSLTRKEFVEAFEQVINLIIALGKRNSEYINSLKETHKEFSEELTKANGEEFKRLRKEIMDYCSSEMRRMVEEHNSMVKLMRERMESLRDGKNADEEKIVETVLAQITLPEQKEVILDSPAQLRDKLETLKNQERLDVSAIRGIDERLSQIEQKFGKMPARVFGGRQMRIETFAFDGDGATTTFTLPKEPTAKGRSIWIFYQGQWLQRTTHYTIAKRTLTTVGFTAATGTVIEGFLIWQA